ncbi:hypothetical protein CKAN_02459700 [Cinnamomum micranthum f. kanehirae]|uniref:Uncharacterized protein n=1 Tax=Cinnamomum micranthum f. kanehirae TaxID=337451 RepID=A0A3S3PPS5_9MAGN|nr:hypothetical protein CKAN_02459700 [Cinnamomum micranthum f. kanehirae]
MSRSRACIDSSKIEACERATATCNRDNTTWSATTSTSSNSWTCHFLALSDGSIKTITAYTLEDASGQSLAWKFERCKSGTRTATTSGGTFLPERGRIFDNGHVYGILIARLLLKI